MPKLIDAETEEITEIEEDEEYHPLKDFNIAPFNPGGRPSKYEPWMARRNFELLSEGLSHAAACAEFGISEKTYFRWVNDEKKDEFRQSHEMGMDVGRLFWEKATSDHILGKTKLNMDMAYIMKMRNVYGQMTRDPIKSEEDEERKMRELAAIRAGGKVDKDEWRKQMTKKVSNG